MLAQKEMPHGAGTSRGGEKARSNRAGHSEHTIDTSPCQAQLTKPTAPVVNVGAIPAELQSLKQWVLWRYIYRAGKWTKAPFQPTGYHAKSDAPQTWHTFAACIDAYHSGGFDGIGIVCANRLCGFDIDRCIDPDERWRAWAVDIVCGLDSYSEYTPSGAGIRVLFFGRLPDGWRKNAELGIECYDRARYFTVTGAHISGTPDTVEERAAEAAELHARYAPVGKPRIEVSPQVKIPKRGEAIGGRGARADDDIIRVAGRAKNSDKVIALLKGDVSGYQSASEADAALCAILAHYTQDAAQIDRIFRRSGLFRPDKWDARHYQTGVTYGQMTIDRALRLNGVRHD